MNLSLLSLYAKHNFFFLIMQNILLLICWYHQPWNTYAKCIKVTNPPALYKCVCIYMCVCKRTRVRVSVCHRALQLNQLTFLDISNEDIHGSNYPFPTMPNEAICFILLRRHHFYSEKLHFTTLNYISYYTFHPTLFECMFCTLNYYSYYTLHLNIKFAINLHRNLIFRVQSLIENIV